MIFIREKHSVRTTMMILIIVVIIAPRVLDRFMILMETYRINTIVSIKFGWIGTQHPNYSM